MLFRSDAEAATSQADLSRDETFAIQAFAWAGVQQKKGKSPVYLYNFNRALPAHTPATAFGAFHSGEIVYAYDNLHTLDRPWEAADRKLATEMSSYWLNFVKTGNPDGKGLPHWPAFTTTVGQVMLLEENLRAVPNPGMKRLEWLHRLYSR